MKAAKFLLAAAVTAVLGFSAQAQTTFNVTGATAFRSATINSIVAAYGGISNVGIISSVHSTANYNGSNAISFRGTIAGVAGETIVRARFSGSTEGIRDLVGNGTSASADVFYYPDASIPAVGNITYTNTNSNPTDANVAQKPDVAFSDVQQNSSPFRAPVLGPADSRVGAVTFVFAKSQGSATTLTNVTAQAWKAAINNARGVQLSVFTGLSTDASGRVLATGRNDGSGTRAVYLIETGYGAATTVNGQFKLGVNGSNGITSAGSTGDVANILQLWPISDAADANNNSTLWGVSANGNGGYFSGGNVATLLSLDTSAVRVYGPTGAELTAGGTYVSTATTGPRQISVVSAIGTSDGLTVINGGGDVLAYNGVKITPVPTSTDPTGLVPADRYKVTNGAYTLWSWERLFYNPYTGVTGDKLTIANTIKSDLNVTTNIGNAGITVAAMSAVQRTNDGDIVRVP